MGPNGLTDRLRLGTRDLHRQAESTGVMAALLRGTLARDSYCALLRNLHAIYTALESAIAARSGDATIDALPWPELRRQAALAHDLDTLGGPGWRERLPLVPAAADYVARLQGLAAVPSPSLLLAHAYVRYLGDLHGGQLLKQRVAGRLAPGPVATRFYEFGDAGQVQALIARFRSVLAAMQPDPVVADGMVAEARWAFEHHIRLFGQLQPG